MAASPSVYAGHEEEIKKRLADGEHPTDIARSFGREAESIRRFCNAKGIEVPRRENQSIAAPAVPTAVDDPERLKLARLEALIASLRRENLEYGKALVSQHEFFERVVEATRVPVEINHYNLRPRDKPGLPVRSVVIPIYDQQYGQLVRSQDVPGGKGEYNAEIFDARLQRWLEGTMGNIRDYAQSHNLEEAVIVYGGDHVEGDEIFAGQPWQLELDPCRQVWSLAEKMADAMKTLIKFLKEEAGVEWIALYAVDDNHGKVGGKKKGATPSTYSWNWLFQMSLQDKLRGEPIDEHIVEPAGSVFFYAAGIEFQAIHGHTIRGWGGIPFYGIQRHDAKSVRLHSRVFRYGLMGHIHQPAEITVGTGAEWIVSGDWVGGNNLSGMIQAVSRPQQKLLYVAPKWGITESARIYLTEAVEAFEPTQIYGNAA